MRETFMKIILGFCIIICLLVSAAVFLCIINAYGEFEYTTASGEKGTATYCMTSYSSAHCRAEDGTELIVESFRKVK